MVVDYVFMHLSFCFKKLNVKKGKDIDDLVMGMASQIAEREDNIVVEDLRGFKSFLFTGSIIVCYHLFKYLYKYLTYKFMLSALI